MWSYVKHQNERDHDTSNILGANISDANIRVKPSIKTVVDLRWHKRDEYTELSSEQKHKLYDWQKSKDGKASINQSRKKKNASKMRHSSDTSRKYLQSKISALEAKLEKCPTVL